MRNLVETMDANLLRAFGIDGAASLSTPEGFVGYAYFGYALLILAIFAVIAGLNITSSEEDSGIMDMVLALPIARWKIVVEKILAYSVMIVGITAFGFIGLLAGNQMASADLRVDTMALVEGSFNIVPGTLLILTLTAFVGTLVRRRIVATSIAGGFVAFSFLLDAVGKAANSDVADSIRQISVFAHYDGSNILLNGLAWGSIPTPVCDRFGTKQRSSRVV